MAEFQELIKNFDRIRDYMRQFYVYGFKVRGDFTQKSARTYDNERRRIESWMSGRIRTGYTQKGKQVSISLGETDVSSNPLYAAWKSKSFTDNDLLLHFFILDLFAGENEMTAGELADAISASYGIAFDSQTVRLKLKEYEALEILTSRRDKKSVFYRLHQPLSIQLPENDCARRHLMTAVAFFSEYAPFGFIGSTILDQERLNNSIFSFKHHFIVHTLEDGILYPILTALREGRYLFLENHSVRSGRVAEIEGLPLKIFVSTRTGRRYVCIYVKREHRFLNLRLDCIAAVRPSSFCNDAPFYREKLEKNIPDCFGVSFGGRAARLEELCLKLHIDEEKEPHILNRLYREGHGGEIIRAEKNTFIYSGFFFDVNEILSWVKSFTGRILDIQSSNQSAVIKVTADLEIMYRMYCREDSWG
ncbi:WYL domain-containing protein [Clostridium sp. AM58-1XD]|uniref:WYL domain-containing protein n=1 Tax=Clostridium sp. AM58-1XD TaxID=2292307 RepID=UPI000E4A1BCB|nr:WYL domain-containing protein [Clostridium sp. AM58-1XD]RGY97641.1 WYL domain-containing protein [Clostridium sp. AM58-1XD]